MAGEHGRRGRLPDEALVAAVRDHADRVHDVVRRLGCSARSAPGVVSRSALALVDEAARDGGPTAPLVGRWYARAADLAATAGDDPHLPVPSGPLAEDDEQRLLTAALDHLTAADCLALLLRDAHDLPVAALGAALEVDDDDALTDVGQARLRILPLVFDDVAPPVPFHASAPPAALARLAEGDPVEARDGPARRHVQACGACRAVVEAQEDVRRLVAGLAVVALPDADRSALLERVRDRARDLLPAGGGLLGFDGFDRTDDRDDRPVRLLAPLPVLVSLVLAVMTGLGLGVLLSAEGPVRGTTASVLAPVVPPTPVAPPTAAPEPADAGAAPSPEAVPTPTTTVFTLSPSPAAPPPDATPAAAVTTLTVSPGSGPDGGQVTLSGVGWTPGRPVVLRYLGEGDRDTGVGTSVVPDATGAWSLAVSLVDPTGALGPHTVVADDGQLVARASYAVV